MTLLARLALIKKAAPWTAPPATERAPIVPPTVKVYVVHETVEETVIVWTKTHQAYRDAVEASKAEIADRVACRTESRGPALKSHKPVDGARNVHQTRVVFSHG